ncbi:MAG: hypothetical protein LBG48_00820 [Rickettsiales bacterium]|nr:hypothetical protein [Rickettsiales bacterium]
MKITVGRIEAEVPYTNEKQKILIEKISEELNVEFNTLRAKIKGVDEIILLFFLLFKTQSNILKKTDGIDCTSDTDEYLMKIFYETAPFVCSPQENKEQIGKFLVAVNIYKKIELNNNPDSRSGKKRSYMTTIEEFTQKIKEQIKLTQDKISIL